ncbi:16125_t:CDS:1, partial [Racocetra fulgida]
SKSISRVPLKSINVNELYNTNKSSSTESAIANANDGVKHKYICQICGESGHNAR